MIIIRIENVLLNLAYFDLGSEHKNELNYDKSSNERYVLNSREESVPGVGWYMGNNPERQRTIGKRCLIRPYYGVIDEMKRLKEKNIHMVLLSEFNHDFCKYYFGDLDFVEFFPDVKPGNIPLNILERASMIVSSDCRDLVDLPNNIKKVYAAWGSQNCIEPICKVDGIIPESDMIEGFIAGNMENRFTVYKWFVQSDIEKIKRALCKKFNDLDKSEQNDIWNPLLRYIMIDTSEISKLGRCRCCLDPKKIELMSRQELFNLSNQRSNYSKYIHGKGKNYFNNYGHGWGVLEVAVLKRYWMDGKKELAYRCLPGRTEMSILTKVKNLKILDKKEKNYNEKKLQEYLNKKR